MSESDREKKARRNLDAVVNILKQLGRPLKESDIVLDLGCGRGELVYSYRKAGQRCFGCDFSSDFGDYPLRLKQEQLLMGDHEILRQIEFSPYRLPFEDSSVTVVVSHQVLEHVNDHNALFKEIARVLQPAGISLHFFPPKWSLLEAHLFVPFAGAINYRWYLSLFALLGIRNRFQKNMTHKEAVDYNQAFLLKHTNYLSKRELYEIASKWSRKVQFVEGQYFSAKFPWAKALSSIPLLPQIISGLFSRAMYCEKSSADK